MKNVTYMWVARRIGVPLREVKLAIKALIRTMERSPLSSQQLRNELPALFFKVKKKR